ncbi:hypothetical protein N0V84_010636 [Fusarium piperis]|uniref:Uncharacterized protein n=1 Tax=Fusarium piperis TaxID=1435070 RepID=A0A9W8TDL9_9HYPO|nr:hypothetical protein N0V84_010636 [Fusarium piperis]
MPSKTNLLALPYEVREQIFQHYFEINGGYVYDGESEKLVTADGQLIDLSLMYTCRSIADDTKHIPLSVNTITFSTVYREDWRERAGGLAYILDFQRQLQVDMIHCLVRFITPEMYSQLGLKFPQSTPNIREHLTAHLRFLERTNWHHERRFDNSSGSRGGLITRHFGLRLHQFDTFYWTWGVTDSSVSGAIAYTLRLLAEKHPAEFAELIDEALPGWTDSHSPDELLELPFDPWAIPSLSELVEAADRLRAYRLWECLEAWHHAERNERTGNRYREKLYFSAAAIAIRFLDQLPEPQRLQIRNMIINEDRLAVGRSEGHILGLIPFCRENPRLRVEQRVNLWRNLTLRLEMPSTHEAIKLAEDDDDDRIARANTICFYRLHAALASWGLHVMEVVGEGMPAGTFSFVLDGDPDLHLSSDLFDRLVHPTVAWLKAYTECSSRGLSPQPYQDLFYFPTAAYLKGIEPLLGGASFLRSNFNLGQPWDYDKLVDTHQGLPFSTWKDKFYKVDALFDMSSPALELAKVKLELFEQQRESDYLDSSLNHCKREKKRLRRVRRRWACIEAGAEDEHDTEAGQAMRILFGDVHKAPPCMTRFEKRMHRKERRAQKAAAGVSDHTQTDVIDDMEAAIFKTFFEPRTGLWWW